MSDSFGKQVEQWIASAMPVTKGGPGSGRHADATKKHTQEVNRLYGMGDYYHSLGKGAEFGRALDLHNIAAEKNRKASLAYAEGSPHADLLSTEARQSSERANNASKELQGGFSKADSLSKVRKGGQGSGRYPKGQHAEVATRLRQIAEKAKANDWNSPRTTSRLNTDALGRTYRPQYGSTAKGLVRIANYHIGTLATKLANDIESDTSKPISQHIAEIRDQASKMFSDASWNSSVDNYSTAQDLREKAEILGKLAGLVEQEFPATPETIDPQKFMDEHFIFANVGFKKGGAGSGRFPKGSGDNESVSMGETPANTVTTNPERKSKMTNNIEKAAQEWVSEILKGGEGSGRYPKGSGGGYTVNDIATSASGTPATIAYGSSEEIAEAADEHATLAGECRAKAGALLGEAQKASGVDKALLDQAVKEYGKAARLHSIASQLVAVAFEATQNDTDGEEYSQDTLDALNDAENASYEAMDATNKAITFHCAYDDSELPDLWNQGDKIGEIQQVREAAENYIKAGFEKSKVAKGGEGSGRYPKGYTSSDYSRHGGMAKPSDPMKSPKRLTADEQVDLARSLEKMFDAEMKKGGGKTEQSHSHLIHLANGIASAYSEAAKAARKEERFAYEKQARNWRDRADNLSVRMHASGHNGQYQEPFVSPKVTSYKKSSVDPKAVEALMEEADQLETRAVELAEMGLLDASADYCREAADCFDVIVELFKPTGDGEAIGEASAFAMNLRASANALLRLRDEVTRPSMEFNIGKGGAGSGEHEGHPFRGNRFTVGHAEKQAMYHDVRSGTENFHHGEHLDAANSHIKAAESAMKAGDFSVARSHYNEAAYHASQATHQLRDASYPHTNDKLAAKANDLYYKAHKAGDAAGKASKSGGDVRRHERQGNFLQRTASRFSSTGRHLRATAKADAQTAHGHKDKVTKQNEATQTTRSVTQDPTLRPRTPKISTRYRRANAPTSASDDVYNLTPRRRA